MHSRKLLPWYGLCLCTTSILSPLWKIPRKLGMISLQRRCKKRRQNQVFSIRGLTFEKINPEVQFTRLRGGYLCSLVFYRTAIKSLFSANCQHNIASLLLCFHCHSGSNSQPSGNPIARRSISGKSMKSQRSLARKSLFGEIISRKYLMMQML